MIPILYLKGISTGDFTEALAALLGPERRFGLSVPRTDPDIARLDRSLDRHKPGLRGGSATARG